ncbi:DUF4339 domain-containing protein [Bradyrhizobium sp. UFLA05-153]
MASEDDAIWHVLINGAQRGPLRRSQLLMGLRDGTISGDDLVWRPGFENWVPLREVRGFWVLLTHQIPNQRQLFHHLRSKRIFLGACR